MDFQPDRIDFSANLADAENGSVLPLKYSIGVPLKPGDNPNDAADYAYRQVSEWAGAKGLIIAGHGYKTSVQSSQKNEEIDQELQGEIALFRSFKTKAECETYLPHSPFKFHPQIKEIINGKS